MSNTKIFLEQGAAWKIVNGKRVGVTSINAPSGDDCGCQLDCCKGTLTYKSPGNGTIVTIPLDAVAALLGIVPASSSNAPSSSVAASSSNAAPSSSGPAASSSGPAASSGA